MTRISVYHANDGKEIRIPYDENAPCIVCGEPVIGASMGGTAICGACDCGRCRYCGMTIMVFKKEFDGGRSKKELLEHMRWHKVHTPDLVERKNAGLRKLMDELEKRREQREANP